MNSKPGILILLSTLPVAGCMQSAVDMDAERASLRAAADAYHAAAAAADPAAVSALYTSDGMMIPPNAQSLSGLDAIRAFADSFTEAPGFEMSFGDSMVEVGAGGGMGYTLAEVTVTVDGPDGEPVVEVLRDFHLWEKQGGEWKVSVDIWNSPDPAGGSPGPLEGAWIATSVTDAEGNTSNEPQPALYVFTPTHYSMMIATGSEPRAGYQGEEMTDAETLAAYDTFVANSGRYEIDGNILKTRAYVAKDPNYMGDWPENEVTFEFSVDGDTLTLTNQVFAAGTVTTLRQVEGTPNPW